MNSTVKPGIYRHYKGNLYEVIGSALHSETEQQMVIYRALYGDYQLWVRPLTMFIENVCIYDEIIPRFSCIKVF